MHNLVIAPFRASRHLAIWIVWQSTGVTLLAPTARPAPRRAGQEAPARADEWAAELTAG